MADTELVIPCRASTKQGDRTRFMWETDHDIRSQGIVLWVDANEGPMNGFSREDARELFNRLGVWLHTG